MQQGSEETEIVRENVESDFHITAICVHLGTAGEGTST